MATARERPPRFSAVAAATIELPTIDSPQFVNKDGYEVDAQTFALALQRAADDIGLPSASEAVHVEPVVSEHAEDPEPVAVEGEETVESDKTQVIPEDAEPLLDLADSNVLHYSVVASRQHHLQHLLPHIFSHPPIPANSRPRARPPPKGTFLFPTPPPLVHPLPHREYHAPSSKISKPVDTTGSPAPDADEANVNPKRRKYGRKTGKAKADEVEAPAHEIECIARVTLSIGPISFSDTELWVGRFVQPRAAAPKPPKVKRVPGERKKAEGGQVKRPRPSNPPPPPMHYPPYGMNARPPMAGPSGTGYRPRPSGPPPPMAYPGQPGQPRPPNPPPRTELSPDLIRRVNEAATQHPWLSQIIHRAARSLATKEELAKLGRVVNRLKEGKEVGEGAEDGIVPHNLAVGQAGPSRLPSGPPAQAAMAGPRSGPSAAPAQTQPPSQSAEIDQDAGSPLSDSLSPPPADEGSDSDSDVDMTGPRQVGGGGPGGVDPALSATESTARPSAPPPRPSMQTTPQAQQSAWLPSSADHPLQQQAPGPSFSGGPYGPPPPRDSSSFDSPPPPSARPMPNGMPYVPRPQHYQPGPQAYAAYGMAPPQFPPPPPRPTYNLPPPFLLVAFKEAPTEKFQLPLGSLSYISRVGDKDETVNPQSGVASPATVAPERTPENQGSTQDPTPVSAAKSRTRTSLAKSSDLPTPPPTQPDEAQHSAKTKKPNPTSSTLPILPGAAPPNGTILISTFIPSSEWRKPDWDELGGLLPFNKPFDERPKSKPTVIKEEPASEGDGAAVPGPVSDANDSRPGSETPSIKAYKDSDRLPIKGNLLNIAAESFFPDEGAVQAITIRLSGVTDQTWQRLKTINGMVTTAEMKALSEHLPDLMPKPEIESPIPTPAEGVPLHPGMASMAMPPPPPGPVPPRTLFQPSPELRKEYFARKKGFFRRMLSRVPTRKFLKYRLPEVRPDILDATADKWGPKSYPISTKAQFNRDVDYDDQPIPLSPIMQPKKGKKALEPEVTFELPVSLDQLDEMVAENAAKGKKGKGMDGRKRTGKRWTPGTICEGCGDKNKRVWRSGPGGPRSLCNSCGDKFTAGELGPLVAPGAAHKGGETDKQDQNKDAEGGEAENPAAFVADEPSASRVEANPSQLGPSGAPDLPQTTSAPESPATSKTPQENGQSTPQQPETSSIAMEPLLGDGYAAVTQEGITSIDAMEVDQQSVPVEVSAKEQAKEIASGVNTNGQETVAGPEAK